MDVSGDALALRTRAFLRRFLEEYFGPGDLGAVVLGGRGLATFGHEFTNDPHLSLDAIGTIQGGNECRPSMLLESGPGANPGVHIINDRANRERVFRLRQFAELLASVPGGRKTMLYFSNCVGFDMFDVLDYRGGVLSLAGEDAHAAIAAATRGNVVIYPIDPAGLTSTLGFASLEHRMDLVSPPPQPVDSRSPIPTASTRRSSGSFRRTARITCSASIRATSDATGASFDWTCV